MHSNLQESSGKTMKTSVSYANVTKQDVFPTKEQVIILDSIEGITIMEYASTIAKLTGPSASIHIKNIK